MIKSVGLEGMKGYEVIVEADVRTEKEQCVIVGLPDTTMKESKERILSNLHALNIDLSMKKITIHLSPSDKRKVGTGYDCAMLLAVLQQVLEEPLRIDTMTCILGGLSLTGEIVSFHGLIPSIQQALQLSFKRIVIPAIDTSFLGEIDSVEMVPLQNVEQLLEYFKGQLTLPLTSHTSLKIEIETDPSLTNETTDFAQIYGHQEVKRALEIAAAGGHHTLLSGPPGCGKSMLADAFHTIFPYMSNDEMLEIFSVYHLAKEKRNFSKRPPFRAPHHSSSATSLIGGGTFPKPGEISLAHKGVLFLDELGEFSRKALDMLRQPLEKGEVNISRVRQSVTYPAAFTLIAATNPCPCGYAESNERYCTCTAKQIKTYQLKASGPLLDRLDFMITLKSAGIDRSESPETSAKIRQRTQKARSLQNLRYQNRYVNGNAPVPLLLNTCGMTEEQMKELQFICYKEKWSNRTQVKIIRIARTIADLQQTTEISEQALQETIEWKRIASLQRNQEVEVTTIG